MKVLLCEDVEKLGWYGDIVDVADGYARNYLLPCRIATVPDERKIKAMADEKAKRANERKMAMEKLAAAAEAVTGAEVVVSVKANEQGHLFGSVSEKEIGENLRGQGFEVADKFVQIAEHIKEVGQYTVEIKFAAEIVAEIKLTVVPEGQIEETADDSEGQTNAE